jgi:hypothetical protein
MEIRSPNPRLTEFPFLGCTFGKATTSASSHKSKAYRRRRFADFQHPNPFEANGMPPTYETMH